MKLNWLDIIALVLVVIGGLNWGLVGAFNYNLVDQLLFAVPLVARLFMVWWDWRRSIWRSLRLN